MMNPDVKKMWLDALRSGEYTQGPSVLHDVSTDSWCCLGVLCDLAEKAWIVQSDVEDPTHTARYFSDPNDIQTTRLPSSVMRWAGLDWSDPLVCIDATKSFSCIEMNDSRGMSFEQIADAIEGDKYL